MRITLSKGLAAALPNRRGNHALHVLLSTAVDQVDISELSNRTSLKGARVIDHRVYVPTGTLIAIFHLPTVNDALFFDPKRCQSMGRFAHYRPSAGEFIFGHQLVRAHVSGDRLELLAVSC